MQFAIRSLTAALVASCLPALAQAQAPAARVAVPKYNWIEADVLASYFGDEGGRYAGQGGRVSTSLLIAAPLYFTGGFELRQYGIADEEIEDRMWSAGLGAFVPLAPSTHVTLAVTYEGGTSELTDAGGSDTEDDSGIGVALGLRAQATPSVEAGAGYKYVDQTAEGTGGASADRTVHAFEASLVGNLSPMTSLVFRIGRDYIRYENGGAEATFEQEAYSIGLRLRL